MGCDWLYTHPVIKKTEITSFATPTKKESKLEAYYRQQLRNQYKIVQWDVFKKVI
jgi:hypothetical protein